MVCHFLSCKGSSASPCARHVGLTAKTFRLAAYSFTSYRRSRSASHAAAIASASGFRWVAIRLMLIPDRDSVWNGKPPLAGTRRTPIDVISGALGPQAWPGSPAGQARPRVLRRPADSALSLDSRILRAGVNGTTSIGSPSSTLRSAG